ncbi:MAG: MarR family transcriptional regulator [Deltaproteobacteria bacterium]|nr:MarR family transcriptional regulator [Deltaproteobacteria bacterium]
MSAMIMPPSEDPPSISPAYTALMQRLVLPLALEGVHRTLTRAFDLDARQHGPHHESILRLLLCIRTAPEGAMRAREIGAQMLKSTSHMSRLIDRAEASDLAERQADPSDRRAYRVALTPHGEFTIDAYIPRAIALLDEAFATVLTRDELRTLLDLVARVEASAVALVTKQESGED